MVIVRGACRLRRVKAHGGRHSRRRLVVNAVNVLQSAGFLARISTGSMAMNRLTGLRDDRPRGAGGARPLGFRACSAQVGSSGSAVVHIAFIVLMIVVDYVSPLSSGRLHATVFLPPTSCCSSVSILLMGIPMFRLNRGLWMVTVANTVLLLSSMLVAMRKGVG